MSITITLPWPDPALSPNKRNRWERAAAAKHARADAFYLTQKSQGDIKDKKRQLHIRFEFHPPDKRKRDADNMIASCKPYIDGIFDCLQIDDSLIKSGSWEVLGNVKDGAVVITVSYK